MKGGGGGLITTNNISTFVLSKYLFNEVPTFWGVGEGNPNNCRHSMLLNDCLSFHRERNVYRPPMLGSVGSLNIGPCLRRRQPCAGGFQQRSLPYGEDYHYWVVYRQEVTTVACPEGEVHCSSVGRRYSRGSLSGGRDKPCRVKVKSGGNSKGPVWSGRSQLVV